MKFSVMKMIFNKIISIHTTSSCIKLDLQNIFDSLTYHSSGFLNFFELLESFFPISFVIKKKIINRTMSNSFIHKPLFKVHQKPYLKESVAFIRQLQLRKGKKMQRGILQDREEIRLKAWMVLNVLRHAPFKVASSREQVSLSKTIVQGRGDYSNFIFPIKYVISETVSHDPLCKYTDMLSDLTATGGR